MNLKYKRATLEDIDILTETRVEVLRATNMCIFQWMQSDQWNARNCMDYMKEK